MRGGIAYRPVESKHVSKEGELIITSKIDWQGEVDVTADQVISAEADVGTIGALEEAAMFLKDFLADGPKKSNDVFAAAAESGIARKTLYRAASHINVTKEKDGYGGAGGWIWSLPDEHDLALLESWAGTIEADDKPHESDPVGT